MKFKKLLAMALVASFALSNVVTVSATEMSIAEDSSQTGTVPSGFNVDEDIIGAGVVVRVPANLDLTYNSRYDAFTASDVISVAGSIRDYYVVSVATPNKLDYTLADSDETITADVKFGLDDEGTCIEVWNSTEVQAGVTTTTDPDTGETVTSYDFDSADSRSININLASMDVSEIGDYSATAEFEIDLAPLGLKTDIYTPTFDSSHLPSGVSIGSSGAFSLGTTYEWYHDNQLINLNALPDTAVGFSSTSSYGTYEKANKYLTTIQLASDKYYSSSASTSNISAGSCFNNYSKLTSIIVPADITTDKLKISFNNDNGTTTPHDYHDTVISNTDIVIGDAIVFITGKDADNKWIYVPHIIYQGTTDQWKALSGHDDWVFGNAANVVKVHCTDGILTY